MMGVPVSLNVRKYYDDAEMPYWCVERRSKNNGHVIHETVARFDNGKDAEVLRKDLASKDSELS